MKIRILLGFLLFFHMGFSQTVFGRWTTIDDETGKEKGIVEIYEFDGKVYGKIVEILQADRRHQKCTKCEGADKNKPVLGLVVIKGLTRNGDVYDGGRVIDPKTGESYHCKITLKGRDKLVVRGYIGFSLFGRSQTWIRQK